MNLRFSDLWRWNGEITRRPFLAWGVLLFAVKYNLDRLLLNLVFDRDWSILDYFSHPIPWLKLSPAEAPQEYALLLAVALPFLLAGLALCVKRLRSAQLPLWLAVLFVTPILKWFLFVALSIVPPRRQREAENLAGAGSPPDWLGAWFPKSVFGSAVVAVTLSALLALIAVAVGTQILRDYGWGLFLGVPFCLGFLATIVHGARQPRTLRESLVVTLCALAITAAALLLVALEGFICILMAAPLALALAAVGALVGHAVQAGRRRDQPGQLYCIPMLALPLMLAQEHFCPEPPPLLKVETAIEVNAPPERVWLNVVSFAELPPPREVLFRVGLAYPIRAEIQGRGVGAVRHCVFSTGAFVEPIAVWDAPRLLKFNVTQNPPPMQEWTPYHQLNPPHLKGFLVSRQGQFRLIALPDGRTRLEGTTWYHHNLWPARYWQLWSDHIIHTIHNRVLDHVKQLSEKQPT